ncbi:MAG: SMI1/KNR4 family protein [Bacteroidia bacterium]|nr:SMI1/KNR4 family protein [Bacteroidia bacterium]
MSKVNFSYSKHHPIQAEEIQSFENEFEITLPQNLKQILLRYNGGTLDGKIEGYAFSFLFPIKYGNNTLEKVIDDLQITEQHIPREEIPFADDENGNIFTISTREEDYGQIYYWEMDVGEPRRSLAATSLEKFFGVDSFEEGVA